jgi:transcriptional regulator with XRE-family HTH domain
MPDWALTSFDMQQVSTRIRERMDAQRLTVKALSEITAIPRMTLTRRLADPSSLTLNELERVAMALDTSPVYLATGREVAA